MYSGRLYELPKDTAIRAKMGVEPNYYFNIFSNTSWSRARSGWFNLQHRGIVAQSWRRECTIWKNSLDNSPLPLVPHSSAQNLQEWPSVTWEPENSGRFHSPLLPEMWFWEYRCLSGLRVSPLNPITHIFRKAPAVPRIALMQLRKETLRQAEDLKSKQYRP